MFKNIGFFIVVVIMASLLETAFADFQLQAGQVQLNAGGIFLDVEQDSTIDNISFDPASFTVSMSPSQTFKISSSESRSFTVSPFADTTVTCPAGKSVLTITMPSVGSPIDFMVALGAPNSCVPLPQSITLSISDNTVGFGALSNEAARYATGDTEGSASDAADAHTVSASSNALGGYVITVNGATLTNVGNNFLTISPIGGVAAASSPGTPQFGIRLIKNSGTGAVDAPYSGANWALDVAGFPSRVASGNGDDVTTVFGVRYIANISGGTAAGNYNTVLTYAATATF